MPLNQKLVSIVIPTYNRSKLLDFTLASIKNQHFDKAILEVLVIDDGSSDDTASMIKGYEDHLSIRYFFQEDKGYRVASARNIGIDNARGEIIIFVDSGMILGRNFVKAHFESHETSNTEMAVIGYMFGLQEKKSEKDFLMEHINVANPDETMRLLIRKRKCLDIRQDNFHLCNSKINDLPAPWSLFWTGNASVKRDALLKTGFFDINFNLRWGMEDIDLGYRLYKNNIPFTLNRKAASIHYPHPSDTAKKLKEEAINKTYFHTKHLCPETEAMLSSNTVLLNLELAKNTKAAGREI
ncbi:MAG TPA: glycosyltransferase [Puia sp.]|nr:glycosyltransferase [Puia sp.]